MDGFPVQFLFTKKEDIMKKRTIVALPLFVLLLCCFSAQVFASDTRMPEPDTAPFENAKLLFDFSEPDAPPYGTDDVTGADYDKENATPIMGLDVPSELVSYASTGGTWIKSSNGKWWYKHTDGSYTTNGWEYIDGYWYYFDANGWMTTGWLKLSGNWYYLSSSGRMTIGFAKIDGAWYYFNSSGVMATGWQYINQTWYYMGTDGVMVTGWQQINGTWYYFDSNGALVSNT